MQMFSSDNKEYNTAVFTLGFEAQCFKAFLKFEVVPVSMAAISKILPFQSPSLLRF